jgi:hypothetical protein
MIMAPEVTSAELTEIAEDFSAGRDIPDTESATEMDCWREEREPQAG